jgi:hypothetical protein
MLALRPYSIPGQAYAQGCNCTVGTARASLGKGTVEGRIWQTVSAQEKGRGKSPTLRRCRLGNFAVPRVFIKYISADASSDFNERADTAGALWSRHRLSRIGILWIPLSTNQQYRCLLSVGTLYEQDIAFLMSKLNPGPGANYNNVRGGVSTFPQCASSQGWMHGCENKPGTSQGVKIIAAR